MDVILFLPCNLPSSRISTFLCSPFHSLLAFSKSSSEKKSNSFDQSISKRKSLIPTWKKSSNVTVNCSSAEQVLKPRPMWKPNLVTDSQEMEPDSIKSSRRHVAGSVSSDLGRRIENLIFFKKYKEAIDLLDIHELGGKGIDNFNALNTSTYDSLITACISLKSAALSRSIFRHMIECEFKFDLYMMNRVILMHLKCGMISRARHLFDEIPQKNFVSWNTIISGLADAGSYAGALEMFQLMQEDLPVVRSRELSIALRAAAGLSSIAAGGQLNSLAFKNGLYENIFVSCSLIDMYAKCGCIDMARLVFDEMPEKHVVGWNSIIAGYAFNGYSEEALDLYYKMQSSYIKMDHFTYSIIIRVCTRIGSLEQGKQAHAGLVRNGFDSDTVACTALVDLYSKWGRMDEAKNVFDKMPCKNLISWNALIAGYGNHGMGNEAFAIFERLLKERIVPNHVTFLAVLSACSYSRMLGEGREIFELMTQGHKTKPRPMHYACMIELLGREGFLDEALALINSTPFRPTTNMWAALFKACRVHRNLELGKVAAEKLFGMEPEKVGNYIVLFNLYISSGRINDAYRVYDTLTRKGLKLAPACSWIDIKKKPHKFIFGDKSHPKCIEIYKKLHELLQEITKEISFSPRRCLFPDVVEQDQFVLDYHSEILAIAFGVISTPNCISLQVLQSHRVCDDCHHVIKLLTVITRREIVVRDATRFHHFRNGYCSCGEYW